VAPWLLVLMSVPTARTIAQPPLPPSPQQPTTGTITQTLLDDRPISCLKASLAAPTPVRPDNAASAHLRAKAAEISYFDCGRSWCLSPYEWEPANTKSLPLYFEEPELERLGYYYGTPQDGTCRRVMLAPVTWSMDLLSDDCECKQRYFRKQAELDYNQPQLQVMQPLVSAGAFYGRVAMLPYLWGTQHPKEPVYDLGEDNPGSPVPYRKHYLPLSARGAFYEGAAVTGLGFLIP
jgi:hypothetical protein